jgi:putative restriction endonuclease
MRSLCKIYHAAYDRDLLGISPDRIVHLNRDLLAEIGGPMLRRGLQEMHGRRISIPSHKLKRPQIQSVSRSSSSVSSPPNRRADARAGATSRVCCLVETRS